tara:strand:+ start:17528 stop:17725 length:198 start_codon:yes stop_codon:yes gene_type:complete
MKESELIKIKKQTEEHKGLMSAILTQINNIDRKVNGALILMSKMPGYKEAVEVFKSERENDELVK